MEFNWSYHVDHAEGDRQDPKMVEEIDEDRRPPKCHLGFDREKEKFLRPIVIDE